MMIERLKRFLRASKERDRLDKILTASFARRADVENYLLEVAAGRKPPPTPQKCRELAKYLGDPTYRTKP